MEISALLLAGGLSRRMGSACPKQFLPLKDKPIVLYSLEVLLQIEEIKEVIVVCAPQYHALFDRYAVRFALPGRERQDSVYNGLCAASPSSEWILVHDAARPFITQQCVRSLFEPGLSCGVSALAVPAKNTLKIVNDKQYVGSTLDRSKIWEMQTPQLLNKEVMRRAFAAIQKDKVAVTDDVSLAEHMNCQVKLVTGSYNNIKITTQEDLLFAQWIVTKS